MAGLIEWETVEGWLTDKMDMIDYAFENAIKTLTISPFDSSITVIDTAMAAVEGTALVLVSMFFMIQLCNDAMLLKIQSYEQVFKLLFKFVMAKVIVQNARGLMGIIFTGFNSLASGIGELNYGFLSGFDTTALLEKPEEAGFLNLNYLVQYLEVMPTYLILMGACWVINLILIGRLFEIIVYTVISPIPLATFAGEGWHDSAKAFVKSYAAVCLQGLVVIVMFYAFSQIADLLLHFRFENVSKIFRQNPYIKAFGSAFAHFLRRNAVVGTSQIGITITALSLALGVAKSGQWARRQ